MGSWLLWKPGVLHPFIHQLLRFTVVHKFLWIVQLWIAILRLLRNDRTGLRRQLRQRLLCSGLL